MDDEIHVRPAIFRDKQTIPTPSTATGIASAAAPPGSISAEYWIISCGPSVPTSNKSGMM
ncbi:MAG TPA: hypothetical protein ENH84_04250 [Phycisphaerae bacterium]|nr:hypothetical protein [Phycisphaerae bacterium]